MLLHRLLCEKLSICTSVCTFNLREAQIFLSSLLIAVYVPNNKY
jgi:hypothetical protein